jgi:deoxyadenosine/deoxycytidine kinase
VYFYLADELSERLGFRNAEEEERKKKEQADYIAQLKAERENAMIELGKKNKQNAQVRSNNILHASQGNKFSKQLPSSLWKSWILPSNKCNHLLSMLIP